VPVPLPASVTVNANVVVVLNVAVTLSAALIVTAHVPVPVQPAPLQPANVEPELAAALSVTVLPLLKFALQAVPQLMPPGTLVTVPVPLPPFVTLNTNCVAVNVAVTLSAAVMSIVHVPVPLQAALPLQPVNVEPLAGVAVRVTVVPLA
jgi:hypothetical protein